MDFKHGQLLQASYSPSVSADDKTDMTETLKQKLQGHKLYESAWKWENVVERLQTKDKSVKDTDAKVVWFKKLLPSNHII